MRCWGSVVHATAESQLVFDVCETLVCLAGYERVWVGSLEGDRLEQVGWAAKDGKAFLTRKSGLPEFWVENPEGEQRLRQSLQAGRPCIIPGTDFGRSACMKREPPPPERQGAILALPLMAGSRVFGAAFLHASIPAAFDLEELQLLALIVEGLAYGLVNLCGHLEHLRADHDRNRLGQAVEQSAEAIMITDVEGQILYANPAFARVTGYELSEVLGKNPRLLKSGQQSPEFYREMWQTLTAGGVWKGRLTNRRKDGTCYEQEGSISPIRDAMGRITNYVAVMRDVSRERQLEQQLHQAQKMEAVGRLAGGVAHDFNNLVMVINGYGDMLLGLAREGPVRRYAEEIKRAGERATLLTRQLLAFSRQQVLSSQPLNLNTIVTSTEKILRRLIGEDIELETRLGNDLGSIRADAGQIGQVIMNLAVNARDAMPKGGRLVIETSSVQVEPGRMAASGPVPPGPYVVLAVSDTGCGMSAETQARMFEPFFTTKEAGKGTGLGLATVYGVVTQSGGFIECASEAGKGTTFRVLFPRINALPETRPEPEAGLAVARGTETILVAEDEEPVRRLVREGLCQLGYRVLEARHGEEALAVASRFSGEIHLLLTDVVMPEMSGPELARRMVAQRPTMKALFMSGYNEETTALHGMPVGEAVCLRKPFSVQSLGAGIRAVLDSGSRLPPALPPGAPEGPCIL
jgi:PAS domain S-box-containing protein